MSILEAMWLILWAVGCLWAVPALLLWAAAKAIERKWAKHGPKRKTETKPHPEWV